ncbi:MAG: TetR/AcrR family transcriptional regulator [Salinicola sp.]|uniref:TetR/AcrR family transcriptional regulator n=1 Tax=Salinicola sp. TaxID=1978524 RepID=UPI001D24E499|nr:TetR/AcrR family transcriptional regulator [Salinicola sp.]NRB57386.1 TetR/AcrR family transcriptional regulator [Salinicola sp.]
MSPSLPKDSPPTTERGRQRRDALLDAAQQLFLERGYGQVSVNDIVGRAGGSLSTLYRHFGNKEGLFQAMIERRSHHIYGTLTDEGVDELTIEAALQRLGIELLVKVMDEETLGIYREVVAESPRQSQLARLFFDGGPGRVRLALADYFERQVQRQLMPACDTVELAGAFLGMLLGEWHLIRVLQLESPPSRAAIEDRVTRCVDLFLHGVQGRPSRRGQ